MRRLLAIALLAGAGCVDWEGAKSGYCTTHPGVCGANAGGAAVGGGAALGGGSAAGGGSAMGGGAATGGGAAMGGGTALGGGSGAAGGGAVGGGGEDAGSDAGTGPAIDWLRKLGYPSVTDQNIAGIVSPGNGRTVVAGDFIGTGQNFGDGGVDVVLRSIFIASYDRRGVPEWSVVVGAATNNAGLALTRIAAGPNGSVLVTGKMVAFTGNMPFTLNWPGGATFMLAGGHQGTFTTRFEANGTNSTWVQYSDIAGFIDQYSFGADIATNQLLQAGNYAGSPGFNTNPQLPNGGSDLHFTYGDLDGNVFGRFKVGCSNGSWAFGDSLAFDSPGNGYVMGAQGGAGCSVPITGVGNQNRSAGPSMPRWHFAAKHTPDAGTFDWYNTFAGWTDDTRIYAATLGTRVFAAGSFQGVVFDGGTLAQTSDGGYDLLFVELSPVTGGINAIQSWGTSGDEIVRDFKAKADGTGFWVFGNMARRTLSDGGSAPGLFVDGGVQVPFIAELSSDLSVPMGAPRFFNATKDAYGAALATESDAGALHLGWQLSGEFQAQPDTPVDAGSVGYFKKTSASPTDLLYGVMHP